MANLPLGTPLGGRLTVPIRKPSPGILSLPNLTIRIAINRLPYSQNENKHKSYQETLKLEPQNLTVRDAKLES